MKEKTKKIKLCVLISRFYPLIGGAEIQALNLSRELIKRNVSLFVLTQRWSNRVSTFENIRGVPVYRLSFAGPSFLRNFSFILLAFLSLLRREKEFDILRVDGGIGLVSFGLLLSKLLDKKIVWKITTPGKIKALEKSPGGKLLSKILQGIDRVTAQTREIEEELKMSGFLPERIIPVPHGIDVKKFNPPEKKEKDMLKNNLKLSGKTVLIFTGRMAYPKGIDVLLKVWKDVTSHASHVHLVILAATGKFWCDSLEEEIKPLLKENSKNITFLENVQDVAMYLRSADIFVLPSRWEGLCNSLLEAMACGLRVIASEVGGPKEVIRDGFNGVLIPPDVPQELYQAILRLSGDSTGMERMGMEARRTVEQNYSLDKICGRLIDLYQEL